VVWQNQVGDTALEQPGRNMRERVMSGH
jgi:hypothetical protein